MSSSISKTWIIPATLGKEKVIMQKIAQAIDNFQENEPRLDDILTCAAEACLNAIEHGSLLIGERKVTVTLQIGIDRYLLCVADEGAGFVYHPQQVLLKEKLIEENPRGWGMYLIQKLADTVLTGTKDGQFYIQICFQRIGEREKRDE